MTIDLLYIVKANAALTLFVATYYGLLRQLTFFKLNRFYLVVAVLFAAVYPSLPVPALLPASPATIITEPALEILRANTGSVAASQLAWDWQVLLFSGYRLVAGLLICRLLVQLLSLALVRRRARPAVILGQPVRLLSNINGSFSFGQTIYLKKSVLTDGEALTAELRHEQAHVRQWHTLDVLLAQLATALAWFNPAAWIWRRAVLDNLEYLADQATLQAGLERRAYQYRLLRQQPGPVPAPALAFRFSAPALKKRIKMLNQSASPSRQLYRYVMAVPTMIALTLGYSGARPRTESAAKMNQGLPVEALYYLDGQASSLSMLQRLTSNDIHSVEYMEGETTLRRIVANTTFQKAVVVTTKAQAETRAVREFADRADLASSYSIRSLPVDAILPISAAYIKEHYPHARLGREAREYTKKSTGAAKLQVQLVMGKSLLYIYFSSTGEFLPSDE